MRRLPGPCYFLCYQALGLFSVHSGTPVVFVTEFAQSLLKAIHYSGATKGETGLKRRPNTHRSKHKDKRSHEGYRTRKDRSLREKKADKYGFSTLLEEDSTDSGNELE